VSALKQARKVLSARMLEPKAKLFGLSEDLRVIAAAFDELESQQRALARGLVAAVRVSGTHYEPGVLPDDLWRRIVEIAK